MLRLVERNARAIMLARRRHSWAWRRGSSAASAAPRPFASFLLLPDGVACDIAWHRQFGQCNALLGKDKPHCWHLNP